MPCRRFQTVGGAEVFVVLVWHLGNDNELYQSTEASSYAAKTVARSQGTLARPVAAIQEQRSLGVCLRSAGMDVDTKPERIPAVNLKHRLVEVKHQKQFFNSNRDRKKPRLSNLAIVTWRTTLVEVRLSGFQTCEGYGSSF